MLATLARPEHTTANEIDRAITNAWQTIQTLRRVGRDAEGTMRYLDSLLDMRR